ncbi:MAG: enoyl-CoA hydratase [Actinobacteria bacterium]|nr:enoyl-CoA hydratase [Actinomycetota bacterium]
MCVSSTLGPQLGGIEKGEDLVSSQVVLYEQRDRLVLITLNRPEVRNAQNSTLLYALDEAFSRFASDDSAGVGILRGAGPCFSAGHDLGSRDVDYDVSFSRRSLWWDHVGKAGAENRMAREEEVYLGMCRRWRELPKPTIAMVHGACIAGGLMLAWSCDLIVASEDAFFSDPVIGYGVPGVELFAHPWEMGGRFAKEFLFTGERIDARRALQMGMVNRVVSRDELEEQTMALATKISSMPRFALALAKKAINQAEDCMGRRDGEDAAFGLHQLAHAHNAETTGSPMLGVDPARIQQSGVSQLQMPSHP